MIENSENRAVFSAFIEKFPESPQRQLAELQLMLLPPPVEAKKQEETIPESQNELAEENSIAPLPEPTSPQQEQSTVGSKFSESNNRYRWNDVIVKDEKEGLIWLRQDVGEKTFFGARNYCNQLDFDGRGWRLPKDNELLNLFAGEGFMSQTKTKIFQKLSFGNYWTLSQNSETRLHNPWNRSDSRVSNLDLTAGRAHTTCVKVTDKNYEIFGDKVKNDLMEKKSVLMDLDPAIFQEIGQRSSEVIGCGFFMVGCADKSLAFPTFRTDYHIKDYRRVNLWGKDKPWTKTQLIVEKGDKIYLYGTGKVATCNTCKKHGPQKRVVGGVMYFINDDSSFNWFKDNHYMLEGFFSFQTKTAYRIDFSANYGGTLNLTVRDWDTYPPSNDFYDDNSGVYILDIFVIDPDQEKGFNRFKEALFEANPDDENVKAYLGKS